MRETQRILSISHTAFHLCDLGCQCWITDTPKTDRKTQRDCRNGITWAWTPMWSDSKKKKMPAPFWCGAVWIHAMSYKMNGLKLHCKDSHVIWIGTRCDSYPNRMPCHTLHICEPSFRHQNYPFVWKRATLRNTMVLSNENTALSSVTVVIW